MTLLKLAESVDLSLYPPACLPNPDDDFAGQNAWTYGWGQTSHMYAYPSLEKINLPMLTTLQEIEVKILSRAECQDALDKAFEDIDNINYACLDYCLSIP